MISVVVVEILLLHVIVPVKVPGVTLAVDVLAVVVVSAVVIIPAALK